MAQFSSARRFAITQFLLDTDNAEKPVRFSAVFREFRWENANFERGSVWKWIRYVRMRLGLNVSRVSDEECAEKCLRG